MTYYTDDSLDFIPQSITSTEETTGRYLSTTFMDALREGPIGSVIRRGKTEYAINDLSSPIVSKEAADGILKEYRVNNIIIPKEGVTQAYLDLVVEHTKSRAEREQIYQRAPDFIGSGALSFSASLAGSMLDPTNIALMFVPAVGEARAATLLGRTGQRFLQGSLVGGFQSAILQPFTTQAAIMEGEDYTNMQVLSNVALSTLAGGVIPSLAGGVGEGIGRLRAYRSSKNPKIDIGINKDDNLVNTPPLVEDNNLAIEYNYHAQLADDFAFDEIINTHIIDLEHQSRFRISGSQQKTMRTELHDIDYQLKPEMLDEKYKALTEEYHSNTVSGRKAKALAKKEIEELKQDLQGRRTELQEQLEAHKTASQSVNDLNEIRKGRLPERLRKDYEKRKHEIHNRIMDLDIPEQIAIERINSADLLVKDNALRSSIAQAFQGKILDVEPFFDLADPLKRQAAIKKLADNNSHLDDSTMRLINQANDELKTTSSLADHKAATESFNYQYEVAASKAEQKGYKDVKSAIDDAMNYANDDTVSKAAKAYAMCMIGM